MLIIFKQHFKAYVATYSYSYYNLISDVHRDASPIDALKHDIKISVASSFEELLNIFTLKQNAQFSVYRIATM